MSKCADTETALRELLEIVKIHSAATGNNFAWAEVAFAEEVIRSSNGDQVESLDSIQCSKKHCLAFYEEGQGWACECRDNELDGALSRIAELTEMFAQGFDADGDADEWRERAMKSIEGGLPSANAFIKRKQADAIQDWLHGDSDMGDLGDYAESLYQKAVELEGKS